MRKFWVFLLLILVFWVANGEQNIQPTALETDIAPQIVDIYDATQIDDAEHPEEIRAEYTGLYYNYFTLGEVPVLSVHKYDGVNSPLLIFLHGLGSRKENLLPVLSAYADAGYYAVALDAYNQGARYSSEIYCDMWAAMLLTAKDIDSVIEYYMDIPEVDTSNFVLGGFSMGSVETWIYIETGNYSPAAIISFSGICEYKAWQPAVQEKLSYLWLKPWKNSVWAVPERQTQAYSFNKYKMIRSMDVSDNLNEFVSIPIFISIGENDTFFCASNVELVAKTIEDGGNEKITSITYANIGHKLTEEMIEDSISFLTKNT